MRTATLRATAGRGSGRRKGLAMNVTMDLLHIVEQAHSLARIL
jgi:hypothetical protein